MKFGLVPASIVFLLIILLAGTKEVESAHQNFAIQGLSFVGMPYENKAEYLTALEPFGINWISQMPFAFERNSNPEIHFRLNGQWWGESAKGIALTSQMAQQQKLHVLLKPQIWMGGTYTGHLSMNEEDDWDQWTQNYTRFIMAYAQLADSLKLEAFCIGTELQPAITKRPKFWQALIDSIRQVYHGKLTYAANWDEYRKVPFWKQLDWIGVNAYFPLSNAKTPKVGALQKSWGRIIPRLKQFADSIQKPMLFTEIGYRSVDSCAAEPWNPKSKTPNQQAQANALEAFLTSFAKEQTWFKGYFLWKWYPDASRTDDRWHTDYTPQGKKAQSLLKSRRKSE